MSEQECSFLGQQVTVTNSFVYFFPFLTSRCLTGVDGASKMCVCNLFSYTCVKLCKCKRSFQKQAFYNSHGADEITVYLIVHNDPVLPLPVRVQLFLIALSPDLSTNVAFRETITSSRLVWIM